MQFVRVGSKIVNLDQIVQIEIHDDGLTVFYAVHDETSHKPLQLRLFNPEAIALLARVESFIQLHASR